MAKSFAIASLQILSVLLLASLAHSRTVFKHLTVYEHEIRTGNGATIAFVAGLPNKTWGFGQFGSALITDNILTSAVSFKSTLIGRFQGIGGVASLDGKTVETLATIHFTAGEYSGSTLEIKGIGDEGEMAIVGGTKHFRHARGYTTFEEVSASEGFVTAKWDFHFTQQLTDDYPGATASVRHHNQKRWTLNSGAIHSTMSANSCIKM